MWNNIESLNNLLSAIKVIFVMAGLIISIIAISQYKIEQRINFIKKTFRPDVRIELLAAGPNDYFIRVESINLIPFEFRYSILKSSSNEALSGVPLEYAKGYPTKVSRVFDHTVKIDTSKITDGIVRLKANYRSIYYTEQQNDKNLAGTIEKKYDISKGYPIELKN